MVGRKPSPLMPKKKSALKGRSTPRPKKAPIAEEDEEIVSAPPRQPKEKKKAPRRGMKPSAPQQQLSTEDKRQMRRRRQIRRTVLRIAVVVLIVALAVVVWLNWNILAPDKLWASFQDAVSGSVGSYPVDLSGSEPRRLEQVEGYTVVLTDSHLTYLNADGSEVNRYTCTYAEPLVRTEGKYLLVAEQGAQRIQLTTRNKVELELKTEQKIRTVSLNSQGQFAVLTDGPQGYVVQVTVYDKNGKVLYTRNSNRTVTDVVLSPDGTTISAVSVEAVDGTLNTRLEVYSTASASPDARCAYQAEDTLLYRAAYLSDGTLVAVGEQSVVLMNTADGGVSLYAPDGMHVLGYAVGGDTLALALRPYGVTAGGRAVVLSSGGAEQSTTEFEGEFRHLAGVQEQYTLLTDNSVQAFSAAGRNGTVTVSADGRQAVYATDKIVVMGLNRLEAFPLE